MKWYFKQIKIYQMEIYIKVLVISILTFCGSEIYAQKLIDINQAKKIAIANNQKIRVANLEVLKQKASINKAFDLGNTQISGELGQFNSAFFDTGLGISQSFSMPQVYKRKKSVYEHQMKTAESYLKLSETNLNQRLDEIFLEYNYLNAKQSLLRRQDSLYANYLEKSLIRWQTGESDVLEKTSADEKQQYTIQSNAFGIKTYSILLDSTRILRHPELVMADWEIQTARAATLAEKTGLLPGFSAGYKNVSFRGLGPDEIVYSGSDRFSSFQVGVHASIKSAQLQEEIQSQNYIAKKEELKTNLAQKTLIYNELMTQLDEFENRSLPNAQKIRNVSEIKFSSGEINYLDFVVLINQAINIENEYLDLVKQINTLIIELQYLSVSN